MNTHHLTRLLQQVGSESGASDGSTDVDTKPLRIAAIFIILVASLAGSVPPLFLKSFQRGSGSPIALLLRAYSAGVILTLALVHIMPDGFGMMDGLGLGVTIGYTAMGEGYPIGGVIAVFGVLCILFVENIAHAVSRNGHSHGRGNVVVERVHIGRVSGDGGGRRNASSELGDDLGGKVPTSNVALGQPALGCNGAGDHADHTHGCISSGAHAHHGSWFHAPQFDDPKEAAEVRRYQVVAMVMEAGCIFHSVIVGITLGVNTDKFGVVRALTIALVFHQMLEGISLGSVVARADFSKFKALAIVVIYSLTTPVGTAIGIGIAATYDETSITAMAVQGTFDCVSAGLLLYIGLVQMIAEDFSRDDLLAPGAWPLRLGVYGLLTLGAASMCIIAIWA